jgi:DNA polymerase III psi subunit
MDLRNVYDHPANVLASKAAESRTHFNHADAWGLRRAADVLRDYELKKDVTFAALDNEILEQVREAQKECWVLSDHPEFSEAAEKLVSAVDSLLGSAV